MPFLTPELRRRLIRWREVLAGVAAAGIGLSLIAAGGGARGIVGMVLIVAGPLLALAGAQRARFRQGGDGAGVVEVVEGRLVYYGPETGGAIATDAIARLALDDGRTWIVDDAGTRLAIPVDATGAEALFDVFLALPGLTAQDLNAALRRPAAGRSVLWPRPAALTVVAPRDR